MGDTTILRNKALAVYDEDQPGKNTHTRVGDVLVNIVDELRETQTAVSNIEQTIINQGAVGKVQKVKVIDGTPNGTITAATVEVEYADKTDTYLIHIPTSVATKGDITNVTNNYQSYYRNIYNELNNKINTERAAREQLMNELDETVKSDLAEALKDANWIQQNFNEGELGHIMGWSDEIQGYLSLVGLWDDAGNKVTTEWSKFIQGQNSILSTVNKLIQDGELSTLFKTKINQTIADKIASIDLSTEYVDGDSLGNVFRWLLSGLRVKTDGANKKTIAQLISAARNGTFDALADVTTAVDMLTGEANAALSAKVNDSFAQFFADARADGSSLGYFQDLNDVAKGFAAMLSTIDHSSAQTDIQTKVNNYMAGLTLRSDLGNSVAELFALDGSGNSNAISAVQACVRDGIGTLTLTADVIKNIARDYIVDMEKLRLCGGTFYMHSTMNDAGTRTTGMEMVCAESITVNSDGSYTATAPTSKLRMFYNYICIDDLACEHIIMSNGSTATTSYIKMEKGTKFYWYDSVSGNPADSSYPNHGTQRGCLNFDGAGLKVEGASLYVVGDVHYTGSLIKDS